MVKGDLDRLLGTIMLILSIGAFAFTIYYYNIFKIEYVWIGLEIFVFIGSLFFLLKKKTRAIIEFWMHKSKNETFRKNKFTIDKSAIHRTNTTKILGGVLIILVVGIVTIGIYASDSCFNARFVLFTILTITGGAAFLIGAFIGFLFGIPRYNSESSISVIPTSGNTKGISDENILLNNNRKFLYSNNTNLEQVSDWLTKILLGAGLTQINDLPGFLNKISNRVFTVVDCPQVGSPFTSMLIVYFSIGGFFFGYLVTVLNFAYLLEIAAGLKGELDKKDQELDAKDKEINKKDKQLMTISETLVEEDNIGGGRNLPIIKSASTPNITSSDDPQKGKWGGRAENKGYKLSASVKQLTPDIGNINAVFSLTVLVESTIQNDKFEGSKVTFYLHPTFKRNIRTTTVEDGKAKINLKCWGAFTIGAQTEDGTQLELDLAELPGAPDLFKAR